MPLWSAGMDLKIGVASFLHLATLKSRIRPIKVVCKSSFRIQKWVVKSLKLAVVLCEKGQDFSAPFLNIIRMKTIILLIPRASGHKIRGFAPIFPNFDQSPLEGRAKISRLLVPSESYRKNGRFQKPILCVFRPACLLKLHHLVRAN